MILMKHPMMTDTFVGRKVKELPDEVLVHPGMISMQERELLFSLARDFYEGRGVIVDGGAFLGASTMAFAIGLKRNKRISLEAVSEPPIVSYERAITGPNFARHAKSAGLDCPDIGDSFEPILREQIAPIADLVDLHVGDILADPGGVGDIEICFLDILKTPPVARHAMEMFFPKLLVGAYIIQQDYFFHELEYIKVFNEALSEKLSYLGEVRSSAVFRVIDKISLSDLERAFAAWDSLEESLSLHRLAEARTISAARQYMMRISRAHIFARHKEFEMADTTLEEADRLFADVAFDDKGQYQTNMGWRLEGLRKKIAKGRDEQRQVTDAPVVQRQ